MRKSPIVGICLLIPAMAMFGALLGTGCNPGAKTTTPATTTTPPPTTTEKKTPITTATKATIKGIVKIDGPKPTMENEAIPDNNTDKAACEAKGTLKKQTWIVDENGGVRNVVVSLSPPANMRYDIKDDVKEPFKKPAVIDQPYCEYTPHIAAIYANVQPLIVKNSATIGHNTKISGGVDNGVKDTGILKPKESKEFAPFKMEKAPIPIECNLHSWMKGKLFVFDNPYFAVSGKDGEFTIANVPIDVELTIYTWHESTEKKVEQTKMKFKEGDNTVELKIPSK